MESKNPENNAAADPNADKDDLVDFAEATLDVPGLTPQQSLVNTGEDDKDNKTAEE